MDSLLEQRIQYFERLLSTKTRSPIVVQLASLYLEAGRPHDALRYCDNAIAHFPYYTTAHLVRAKVLDALEMKAEARRELEFVHSILPDVASVKTMLEQMPASDGQPFEDTGLPTEEAAAAGPGPAGETVVETTIEPAEEASPGSVPSEEPTSEAEPEGDHISGEQRAGGESGVTEAPRDVEREEDPFGLGVEGTGAPAAETVEVVDTQEPSGRPDTWTPEAHPTGDADVPRRDAPVLPPMPEAYEQYAARMSEELAAGAGALTLEEFFASPTHQPKEQRAADHIEELAERLKTAPRITPIIDIAEKRVIPPSEEDTLASTEFVTPTLAEIYAKQGWYDDAIIAYKTLARIKPAERERFERRIQELEQLKKAGGGS